MLVRGWYWSINLLPRPPISPFQSTAVSWSHLHVLYLAWLYRSWQEKKKRKSMRDSLLTILLRYSLEPYGSLTCRIVLLNDFLLGACHVSMASSRLISTLFGMIWWLTKQQKKSVPRSFLTSGTSDTSDFILYDPSMGMPAKQKYIKKRRD